MASDEPVIEVRVSDWLARVEGKIDAGFASLNASKADKEDVSRLSAQIDGIDRRTSALERDRDQRSAAEKVRAEHREWKRWAIPVGLTLVWIGIAVLTALVR